MAAGRSVVSYDNELRVAMSARKKSPRKGRVPGGQRTLHFSGSDWKVQSQRGTGILPEICRCRPGILPRLLRFHPARYLRTMTLEESRVVFDRLETCPTVNSKRTARRPCLRCGASRSAGIFPLRGHSQCRPIHMEPCVFYPFRPLEVTLSSRVDSQSG